MRSPAPETFSPILSVVDFWESGVTAAWVSVVLQPTVGVVLTLLGNLLAETLAQVVRHVDCCLVGWVGGKV